MNFSTRLKNFPEIFVGGNFIVGLPEETFSQMMNSFRLAIEVDLDWSAITVCQVIRGASAFSDAGEYFEHQMRTNGATVKNFIPSRNSTTGQVVISDGVLRNLNVFRLSPEVVPSEDQVEGDLVHLQSAGELLEQQKPESWREYRRNWISWINTAQRAYPNNPYMMLFLGLAHRLLGHDQEAERCRDLAESFVNSGYWRDRFESFYLDDLLTKFPENAEAVRDRLAAIWERQRAACADWLAVARGENPVPMAASDG